MFDSGVYTDTRMMHRVDLDKGVRMFTVSLSLPFPTPKVPVPWVAKDPGGSSPLLSHPYDVPPIIGRSQVRVTSLLFVARLSKGTQ